jgi:hypothetical protein
LLSRPEGLRPRPPHLDPENDKRDDIVRIKLVYPCAPLAPHLTTSLILAPMATLVLTMPQSPGLPLNYEHRTLRAHEAYKAAGPSFALENTSWLRGQSIMRGTLTSSRGSIDVVAKLGTTSNSTNVLKKELTFYQKLRHLQGDCIPKCFGYFFSLSEDQTFGCLILEYCGKPLRSIYDGQGDIPFALRYNRFSSMNPTEFPLTSCLSKDEHR